MAQPTPARLLAAAGLALLLATFLTWGNGLRNGVIFGAIDELADHEETAWQRFGADALVIALGGALFVVAAARARWRDAAAAFAGASLAAALAFALEEPLFLWDGGPDVESIAAPGAVVAVGASALGALGAALARPRVPRVVALAAGVLVGAALVRWGEDVGWTAYTPITEEDLPPDPEGWNVLSRLERILLLVVAAGLVAARYRGWKLLALPVLGGIVIASTAAIPALSADGARHVGPIAVLAGVALAAAALLAIARRDRTTRGQTLHEGSDPVNVG